MNFKVNNLAELEHFVTENWNSINTYIDEKFSKRPKPIYSSVDIRESKNKIAPIDHNMYPAGFNNLCALDLSFATDVMEKTIKELQPGAKSIGIIPESNTKNKFYLDHLAILGKTISDAGYEAHFISFDENLFEGNEKINLVSHSGFDVEIHHAKNEDGYITHLGEKLDFIVLNNDQSQPLNVDWQCIKTPINPTPFVGWTKRQKINHFEHYRNLANDFANHFEINPNLLQARFEAVHDVDFSSKEGLDRLGSAVDKVKDQIEADQKVFVKASQGTYGMGISVVNNGEEIISMNRKARNKMDIGKNKIKFTSLLVQEGVETVLKYDDMPAEVTIYLVDGKSVGGFMRTNSQKDSHGNLNSRGMVFKKFCISEIRQNQDHKAKEAMYTVVARLATLASTYEIEELIP